MFGFNYLGSTYFAGILGVYLGYGTKAVLVNGLWVDCPVMVLNGGVWVEAPVKVLINDDWAITEPANA